MHNARKVMLAYRNMLLSKKNVVGCGVAYKEVKGELTSEPCVVTFVEQKLPLTALSLNDTIPKKVGAVPTDVVEIGRIKLLDAHTEYARPAQPGMSIGHYKVSAGTFGAVVYCRRTGTPLILSNNHVLANATNGLDKRSSIGDPIYQPGAYDGGTSRDIIGRLHNYLPIITNSDSAANLSKRRTSNTRRIKLQHRSGNLIDAALAKPLDPAFIDASILDIGTVDDTAVVEVATLVKKSGRTSGLTKGQVRAISATLNVELDEDRSAQFVNQIVTTPMGQPGDSGSLGVTEDNRAFGLLFAGSGMATIFNRIDHILEMLAVKLSR